MDDMEDRLRVVEHYCHEHEGKIEERWENQWRHNSTIDKFVEEVRDQLRNIERQRWVLAGAAGVVAAVGSQVASWVSK